MKHLLLILALVILAGCATMRTSTVEGSVTGILSGPIIVEQYYDKSFEQGSFKTEVLGLFPHIWVATSLIHYSPAWIIYLGVCGIHGAIRERQINKEEYAFKERR